MTKPQTCRHCKKTFIPQPGKPGFINECPDCLRPPDLPTPAPVAQVRKRRTPMDRELRRFLRDLRIILGGRHA
jgi:hypothetical protein